MKVNWISTKDRLPELLDRVLVAHIDKDKPSQLRVSVAMYHGMVHGHTLWSGQKSVLYWAPLPELPEYE